MLLHVTTVAKQQSSSPRHQLFGKLFMKCYQFSLAKLRVIREQLRAISRNCAQRLETLPLNVLSKGQETDFSSLTGCPTKHDNSKTT